MRISSGGGVRTAGGRTCWRPGLSPDADCRAGQLCNSSSLVAGDAWGGLGQVQGWDGRVMPSVSEARGRAAGVGTRWPPRLSLHGDCGVGQLRNPGLCATMVSRGRGPATLAVGGMSTCRETACAGRSQRSFISLTRLDREPARGLGEAQASLTLRTGLRRGAAGMVAESLAFGVTRDSRLHGACLGGATQGLWVPGGGGSLCGGVVSGTHAAGRL